MVNTKTLSVFFTMLDLIELMKDNPNSSLFKYTKHVRDYLEKNNTPVEEIDRQVSELTHDMRFASCILCQIDDTQQFSSVHGRLLLGAEKPGTNVWDAQLALKLETDTGSSPLYIITTVPVVTLKVDGEKNHPVILAQAENQDRIIKIVSRGGDGRPWMRRVF
jgi:hypothetical protein